VYASPYKLIIEKGVVNDFNKIPSELEINTYLNQIILLHVEHLFFNQLYLQVWHQIFCLFI
jgi:hypothetical protein